ncbi:MAG TPA: hypothetical protein VNC22_07395 [Sporichthya sp.]|nr:hypothetical protein [Sporichthya sp.]
MRRHDTDPVALTFALIFLGIAGGWLLVEAGAADVTGLRYFFPFLLLGAGGAGVLVSLLNRPGRSAPATAAVSAGDTTPDAPAGGVDTPEGQT